MGECNKHGPWSVFCRGCDLDTIKEHEQRVAWSKKNQVITATITDEEMKEEGQMIVISENGVLVKIEIYPSRNSVSQITPNKPMKKYHTGSIAAALQTALNFLKDRQ